MAQLPNKIYIIDPYDDAGELLANTEDVCWCADPTGDENVAYIAEQTITDALAALRKKVYNEMNNCKTDDDPIHAIIRIRQKLDATIAALGLAPKENDGTN